MIITVASLNQGLLLHTCSKTAAPALLFTLLCCQMKLNFAGTVEYRYWLGTLLRLCQCWRVKRPQKLVSQAPSYAALPLYLWPAYANIMYWPWGYMGAGKLFLAYPVFLLCLWGVCSLPPPSASDPLEPTKLHYCAATAPLLIPTRHASSQWPACNYKVIQIYTLQLYTKPTNSLYLRDIFYPSPPFFQYFCCINVPCQIVNDWKCRPCHLVSLFLSLVHAL